MANGTGLSGMHMTLLFGLQTKNSVVTFLNMNILEAMR